MTKKVVDNLTPPYVPPGVRQHAPGSQKVPPVSGEVPTVRVSSTSAEPMLQLPPNSLNHYFRTEIPGVNGPPRSAQQIPSRTSSHSPAELPA